ncbi:hypothetical protein KC131_01760 [Pseudomonas sp. JQ170]|uniref:hypothetical protein n=1 Tax=unclassified Pseudomonas TaxID=196821 RepID=UPI000F95670E|nr:MULTISPECIES: hypothetical protein [unclassified Pseudomonas]MDN7139355.1 hypothetical protein [Pseudomonas sp. JQ170]WRO77325.1 hypothetical protein U9R80_06495 [Pseudomonas sp. 170C]
MAAIQSFYRPGSWLLGALLLALAGCTSIDARTTEYVGVPHAAPTSAANVEVLRREPLRAHDRLGEILVDASVEPPPPITEVEQKLREEAAKIGGDAVVVVYDRIAPVSAYVSGPLWDRDIHSVEGRKLKGIVIKYR